MKKRPNPHHPGDVLQQARVRAEMSSAVAQSRLGITKQQLGLIEDWKLDELPDNAYLLPILKRYAQLVDVDFTQLQKDFPKAIQQRTVNQIARPQSRSLDQSLVFMSSIAKVGAVLGIVAIIGGYVAWQSSSLSGRPQLDVFLEDQTSVNEDFIEVAGSTSISSQIFVNGTSVLVEEDGSFSTNVVLQTGPNDISIRAVNNVGAEREETVTIVREE